MAVSRIMSLLALLLTTVTVNAATLTRVNSFGSNPANVRMYIYVPDNVRTNPDVVLALHHCQGTAQSYFGSTPYARLADQHGYIVIYPESPYSGTCWDVSSPRTLRYEGGGDSQSIANMVRWTIQQYQADATRVFVVGGSSGGMMTNVMAATYPDLFQAAIVYAGVPAGCFYTGTVNGWNSTCAQGNSIASVETWANTARNMRPGYTGRRPRMMIYHGGTDDIVRPANYRETIKQWAGIFGYSTTPQRSENGQPASGFVRETFGTNLQGNWNAQAGHGVPTVAEEDMRWFGIPRSGSTQPSTTTRASQPTTTSNPGTCTAPQYAQCGGEGFTGCRTCASGFTCRAQNQWYSQCL
ncbi:hypothetical protein S40285_08662 [Stachybotrys chlorohalonatus IBT 40285]|uniref:Carboxylic ester hydrolase n=1 Tax=Stachybotrys chlorohalonatus (strain IBT 40285) TaxID=1283841 RepID=A0A084R0D4_STAC4|nr:hypothetical protein S40285_08662 [Stachybotrys chlorohalonata IBT 40285]